MKKTMIGRRSKSMNITTAPMTLKNATKFVEFIRARIKDGGTVKIKLKNEDTFTLLDDDSVYSSYHCEKHGIVAKSVYPPKLEKGTGEETRIVEYIYLYLEDIVHFKVTFEECVGG